MNPYDVTNILEGLNLTYGDDSYYKMKAEMEEETIEEFFQRVGEKIENCILNQEDTCLTNYDNETEILDEPEDSRLERLSDNIDRLKSYIG